MLLFISCYNIIILSAISYIVACEYVACIMKTKYTHLYTRICIERKRERENIIRLYIYIFFIIVELFLYTVCHINFKTVVYKIGTTTAVILVQFWQLVTTAFLSPQIRSFKSIGSHT